MPCLDQTKFGSYTLECIRITWGAHQKQMPEPTPKPTDRIKISHNEARASIFLISSQGILMNTDFKNIDLEDFVV